MTEEKPAPAKKAAATEEKPKPRSKAFPLEDDHFYGVQMTTRRSHWGKNSMDESGVLKIQKALRVPQTGRYDAATAEAVRKHQHKHDLDETGYVDKATWRTLGI